MSFRPMPVLTILTVAVFAWLCWLGNWQLQRLAWKLSLIEAAEERTTGDVVALADVLSRPGIDDMRYQKVRLTGTFDHAREVFFYSPMREGPGFRVITPLLTERGTTVLVERGWVPNDLRPAGSRPDSLIKGSVSLEGLVLTGGEATVGVAGKQDGDPVWMFRDLKGMSDYVGADKTAPFFVVVLPDDALSEWPRAEVPNLEFTNNHLSYAITWFGLAFALLCVYIAYHIAQGRLQFSRPEEDAST